MKRISFILPCYNVERYLDVCLDSLYNQGIPISDFEVICINDCSTDGTRERIISRQLSFPNLILLDQPRNMLPGAARNRGLEIAQGEYVWFVDSDDLLKPGILGHVFKEMDEGCLDFLMFNFDEFKENDPTVFVERNDIFESWGIEDGLSFVDNHFNNELRRLSLVWLCVFRRSFLQEHHVSFPDLCMSEDSLFLWRCLIEARAVKSIGKRIYIHRLNQSSIVLSPPDARKQYSSSFLFPRALLKLIEDYRKRLPQVLKDKLDGYVRYELNEFAGRYLSLSGLERSKYYLSIRSDQSWFREFKLLLSRRNRLVYLSSRLGEPFFACVAGLIS